MVLYFYPKDDTSGYTQEAKEFSALKGDFAAAAAEVLGMSADSDAVRRVADKLLHQPTTRVKELVNEAGAVSYAAALAELFALDPDAVDAVTRPGKPE